MITHFGFNPLMPAQRGTRPAAVPDKPAVPYVPWRPHKIRTTRQEHTGLGAAFDSSRHVRRYLKSQRGTQA